MIVKLLTEHHLEFLSLKGGCRDSSQSSQVKIPHCWKSHAAAQIRTQMPLRPKCPPLNIASCIFSLFINNSSSMLVDA